MSVYIRNDGFQNSGEVALNVNGVKYFFTAKSSKVGQWSRLIPEKGSKKIPIQANDSILVARFEYGKRLQLNRPKRNLVEDYVLDFRIMDNSGAYATVKISETAPRYIIGGL